MSCARIDRGFPNNAHLRTIGVALAARLTLVHLFETLDNFVNLLTEAADCRDHLPQVGYAKAARQRDPPFEFVFVPPVETQRLQLVAEVRRTCIPTGHTDLLHRVK